MDGRNDDTEPRVPPDVPEGDAVEQSREWVRDEDEAKPAIPPDAPEADVLDQHRAAELDDEELDR